MNIFLHECYKIASRDCYDKNTHSRTECLTVRTKLIIYVGARGPVVGSSTASNVGKSRVHFRLRQLT